MVDYQKRDENYTISPFLGFYLKTKSLSWKPYIQACKILSDSINFIKY